MHPNSNEREREQTQAAHNALGCDPPLVVTVQIALQTVVRIDSTRFGLIQSIWCNLKQTYLILVQLFAI